VNVYVARDGLARGIGAQLRVDSLAFPIHRLQLGDNSADRTGVFVVGGQELRGVLFVRLPARLCTGAKRGVGGSLRSGFFRFNDRGKLGLQVRNSGIEPFDCALVSGNIHFSRLVLRVGHRSDGRKLGADLRLELLDLDLSFVISPRMMALVTMVLAGKNFSRIPMVCFFSFCQVLSAASARRQS
jgi:hypothetical protein